MISGFMPGAPIGNPGHNVLAGAAEGAPVFEPSGLFTLATSIDGVTDKVPVFDKGDRIQMRAVMRDAVTTDLVTGSGLVLKIKKPRSPQQQTVTPQQASTGVFTATLDLDVEGRWHGRWEGQGVNEPVMFKVKPTESD